MRHCAALAAAVFALLVQRAVAQDLAPLPPAAALEPAGLEAELQQRAEAQFALGDIAGALSTHGLLEGALTGTTRTNSRDALWRRLSALPATADFSGVTEPVALGWVQLLQLVRAGAPLSAYEDWRQRHPDHPGESQLAVGLITPPSVTPYAGRQIALLLPLTGPLAAAAKAIQSGAEAARFRAGAESPSLLIADTSVRLDDALTAAQGAVALVGPLRKEDVAAVVARAPALPTITLNYLDGTQVPPAGVTLFGLAPEDEARAAADHASGQSLLRAVVLSQEGDWGNRAAAAFKRQLELRGGTVLGSETYKTNAVDFTAQLKRLLGITYSEARSDKLLAAGVKAEMLPVPRGDIDVIYLAARSAQAKLIWPQMRFLRAGRIATYAPAVAGDAGNRDLGGLQVCDAPWRIDTAGATAALRGELATSNPRSADAQRLFALGYDAYELARRNLASALVPGEEMQGITGTLVLEADGAVHRRLNCVALSAPRDNDTLDPPGE